MASTAISIDYDLAQQYAAIANSAGISWELLFQEALEHALPEIQKRYTCSKCGKTPLKGAAFCNHCGTKLASQESHGHTGN